MLMSFDFDIHKPYVFLHVPPCAVWFCHGHGRAPSIITNREHPRAGEALWADAVDAVVAPASAFGGAGVLSLAEQVRSLLRVMRQDKQ